MSEPISDAELNELRERSIDDRAFIAGSEVRRLIAALREARVNVGHYERAAEHAVHFSSDKHDWQTPRAFFDALDAEFHFTLDAAASADNALCPRYFTESDNALQQRWEGVVWCNPPYGRKQADFVYHGYLQAKQFGATVVFLIPARPDTKVWQNVILRHAEIRWVPGRLKFSGHKNAAPFPCAVVIFRPGEQSMNSLPEVHHD